MALKTDSTNGRITQRVRDVGEAYPRPPGMPAEARAKAQSQGPAAQSPSEVSTFSPGGESGSPSTLREMAEAMVQGVGALLQRAGPQLGPASGAMARELAKAAGGLQAALRPDSGGDPAEMEALIEQQAQVIDALAKEFIGAVNKERAEGPTENGAVDTFEEPARGRGAVPKGSEAASPGQLKIKKGDTLERIALANGLSVAELKRANPGVVPERLKIGSSINVPAQTSDPKGANALQSYYARTLPEVARGKVTSQDAKAEAGNAPDPGGTGAVPTAVPAKTSSTAPATTPKKSADSAGAAKSAPKEPWVDPIDQNRVRSEFKAVLGVVQKRLAEAKADPKSREWDVARPKAREDAEQHVQKAQTQFERATKKHYLTGEEMESLNGAFNLADDKITFYRGGAARPSGNPINELSKRLIKLNQRMQEVLENKAKHAAWDAAYPTGREDAQLLVQKATTFQEVTKKGHIEPDEIERAEAQIEAAERRIDRYTSGKVAKPKK
jgi:LysM repeat protein